MMRTVCSLGIKLLCLAVLVLFLLSCHAKQQTPSTETNSLPGVRPLAYSVTFNLNPESLEFTGSVKMKIASDGTARQFLLNRVDLTLLFRSIILPSGEKLVLQTGKESAEEIELISPVIIPARGAEVEIGFTGKLSDIDSAGLFRREGEQGHSIFSQFEPQSARRAFPCFDAPNWKTPFRLKIRSPKGYTVLSNTPSVQEIELGNSGLETEFAETSPLPTYLLALTVGHFEIHPLGQSARGVPLRLVVPPGNGAKIGFAKEFSPQALAFLENYFGTPYPFSKLDLLAIPSFPGAMENAGLITFNQRLLLRDPAVSSFADQQISAQVIAHELSHQWFGNYVTMSSWKDLWLNEGFASWIGPTAVSSIHPEWNLEISALDDTSGAMRADQLIGARRVREPANSRSDVASAFDGITYGKTAAVLRMFERWIGREKFRSAIQEYVRTHPFGVLSGEDFEVQLKRSFGEATAQAFFSFLDQKGVPLLSIEKHCEPGAASIHLKQSAYHPLGSRAKGDTQWGIPYCLAIGWNKTGERGEVCGLLREKEASLPIKNQSCPDWINGDAQGTGYFYSELQLGDIDALLKSAWGKLSPMEKRILMRDIKASIDAGLTSWASVLDRVPGMMAQADDDTVYSAFSLLSIRRDFFSKASVKNFHRYLDKLFRPSLERLGKEPKAGEPLAAALLRNAVLQLFVGIRDKEYLAFAESQAKHWLDDPKSVNPALKPYFLNNGLMNRNLALRHEVESKLLATSDQGLRSDLIQLLGSADSDALIQENLKLLVNPKIRLSDSFLLMEHAVNHYDSQRLAWNYLKKHLPEFLKIMPENQKSRLISIGATLCSNKDAEEVEQLFLPHQDKIEGGARRLQETKEAIELCAALKAAQKPLIEKRFLD